MRIIMQLLRGCRGGEKYKELREVVVYRDTPNLFIFIARETFPLGTFVIRRRRRYEAAAVFPR